MQTDRELIVAASLTDNGSIDLANNDLDIQSGALSTYNALVKQGFNGGASNGAGITSTAAATDIRHLTALGIIQNNQSGPAIYSSAKKFDGFSPGAGDILIKYTYYGDANLDGRVDGSDYTDIDNGYNNHGLLTGWLNGDFNYDGIINGSDYTLIDNAFNTQGAALSAALIAGSTAEIASVGPSSAVPEPGCTGVLVLGVSLAAAGFFRRPSPALRSPIL